MDCRHVRTSACLGMGSMVDDDQTAQGMQYEVVAALSAICVSYDSALANFETVMFLLIFTTYFEYKSVPGDKFAVTKCRLNQMGLR